MLKKLALRLPRLQECRSTRSPSLLSGRENRSILKQSLCETLLAFAGAVAVDGFDLLWLRLRLRLGRLSSAHLNIALLVHHRRIHNLRKRQKKTGRSLDADVCNLQE